MDFIILLFAAWSITSIFVNGSIFDRFRTYLIVKHPFLGKLFSCTMCLGFWVGLVLYPPLFYFNYLPSIFSNDIPFFFNYFLFPFIQSGFGVLVESFVIYLVRNPERKK
jgi:hypothetical protein